MTKEVPFSLVQNAGPYWRQIVAGVRDAVRNGYYQTGDRLPSILDMATEFGVSHIVVRQAVRAMKAEGLITARRGRGIDIKGGRQVWAGHVLFIYWKTIATFHFARFTEVLLKRLQAADVSVALCPVTDIERRDGFPMANSILDRQPINVAVLFGGVPEIDHILPQRDVPAVRIHRASQSASSDRLFRFGNEALWRDAFLEHCRAAGIRRLALITVANRYEDLRAHLVEHGIGCALVMAPLPEDDKKKGVMDVEEAGYRTVTRLLQDQAGTPDALFFADDWLTRGGLTALLAAGVRVPEDLQVISMTNAGALPIFPKPLTRLEYDPGAAAGAVSEAVMELLDDPRSHRPLVDLPHILIPGDTTRLPPQAGFDPSRPR